jgi:hypothetical protein
VKLSSTESDITTLQVDVTSIKSKTDSMSFDVNDYILADVEAINFSPGAAKRLSTGMDATVIGKVKSTINSYPVNQITVYDLDPAISWDATINSKILNNRVLTFRANGVGAGQVILINDTTATNNSGEFLLDVTTIVEPGTGKLITANDEFIIA